jgi:alkylation response protein AidB-like acyl-CoA dehydrogenase
LVSNTDKFSEVPHETVSAVLIEAGRMCEEKLSPLQRIGDLNPATLQNGVVKTSPGFGDGYKAIAEGGWVSTSADPEYGGMGLPLTITTAVNEMMASACLSLQLNPLMTQGQIEALENHASDMIKNIYLPKLISGDWCGTMNLTESQAGSDVGALSSKATDNGDGSYAITGQKIYISWGDNDFSENVCHLVLARLPDGKSGTKGISLFIVPKFIPDQFGNAGIANKLKVISLEHKLGLHGSPTAVMQYDRATGWLVGEPHDGMRAMFTMMNNARLGVGGQGIGAAEGAYQHALTYAKTRKQGTINVPKGIGTILDHADVRRMLLTMKADIFAARSLALETAVSIDLSNASNDGFWKSRAALLTPIAKSFGTETGCRVAELGVQVHGGMGFIEESGAAQYYRDVRVTTIYEGTNGIQAMDLVGRKLMDGGEAAYSLVDDIQKTVKSCTEDFSSIAHEVMLASEALREAIKWMCSQKNINDRFAGAVPFLNAFARVLGGYFHLKSAIKEGHIGQRTKLARFYIFNLMPEYIGLLHQAKQGCEDLYSFSADELLEA